MDRCNIVLGLLWKYVSESKFAYSVTLYSLDDSSILRDGSHQFSFFIIQIIGFRQSSSSTNNSQFLGIFLKIKLIEFLVEMGF